MTQWDNFLPEKKVKTKEKEHCEICSNEELIDIATSDKSAPYNSMTEQHYYAMPCLCVSDKETFEQNIGVKQEEYLTDKSRISIEYKQKIKIRQGIYV